MNKLYSVLIVLTLVTLFYTPTYKHGVAGSVTLQTRPSTHAARDNMYYTANLGGDCFADLYTDDTWKRADWYCVSVPAEILPRVKSSDDTAIDTTPAVVVPVAVDHTPELVKEHCNKGEGNGSEGCDPGNHPEKGNDDENHTSPSEDHKHVKP